MAAIWSVDSILVAAMTWGFWRKAGLTFGIPPHPSAGVMSGAVSAILMIAITTVFSLPPYSGTLVVSRFLTDISGNAFLGNLTEQFAVELVDKTLSLFLAVVADFPYLRDNRTDQENSKRLKLVPVLDPFSNSCSLRAPGLRENLPDRTNVLCMEFFGLLKVFPAFPALFYISVTSISFYEKS